MIKMGHVVVERPYTLEQRTGKLNAAIMLADTPRTVNRFMTTEIPHIELMNFNFEKGRL